MNLKRKILIRMYLLTFLIILAMSLTYYWLFTKDIRERSQQNLMIAYELIFDDLTTRVATVVEQIDHFVQTSLVNPIYVVQMFQEQQEPAEEVSVWYVKKLMTYLSTIAIRMREFGAMTGAAEIALYGKQGEVLAVYRNADDAPETAVYLPNVNADQVITIRPDDKWYAGLQTLAQIPLQPFPPELTRTYTETLPASITVNFSTWHTLVTLRFVVPIINRGTVEGVCVIHVAIGQSDIERYSRLSGTKVNVFAGTRFSVGMLPEYGTLAEDANVSIQQLDLLKPLTVPAFDVSEMTAGNHAYYQGTLVFGAPQAPVGAMTVHLPRQLEEQQKTRFVVIVIGIAILFSSLAVAEAFGLSGAIVRPITHLMAAMKEMEQGNLDAQAHIRTNDELEKLAQTFNTMGKELKESMHRQQEQERLKQEMVLARQIQTALLPKHMQHDELEIEAIMLPADEVGGDFYDILYGLHGQLWLGIGDVSGHGVTPGLIMMMAQTIHATIITHLDYTPKDVVTIVNHILYHNVHQRLGEQHFMTFTTLKYLGDGMFEHAGAHLSLIVYRQATNTCDLVKTHGVYLNFIENIAEQTTNASFTLAIGDILVLYTDGLTEAKNPEGKLLDLKRFAEIIRSHAQQSPVDMREAIMHDVLVWSAYKRADDMSLVVVRRVK